MFNKIFIYLLLVVIINALAENEVENKAKNCLDYKAKVSIWNNKNNTCYKIKLLSFM